MDDVIDNCQTVFEEDGVNQQTLDDLRKVGLSLSSSERARKAPATIVVSLIVGKEAACYCYITSCSVSRKTFRSSWGSFFCSFLWNGRAH